MFDDVVVDMAVRSRKREQLRARRWLECLQSCLGVKDFREFQGMLRGEILDPSGVILIYDSWTLTPVMHEILEFGFDKSSTNKQIISGVVPGLRAAHAGVEDDSYPCHALVSA